MRIFRSRFLSKCLRSSTEGDYGDKLRIPEIAVGKRSRLLVLVTTLLVLLGLVFGRYLWAHWHYREARRAWELRDFAGAQQHLTQYLKVWPQNSAIHLEAARAARKAGDFNEAEQLLLRCLDLDGEGGAVLVEQLLIHVQRGHLADVESRLVSPVLHYHPDSVLILEVLTLAYIQNYQLFNAQESLARWLCREPDRLEAWLLQAQGFQKVQNPGKAQ